MSVWTRGSGSMWTVRPEANVDRRCGPGSMWTAGLRAPMWTGSRLSQAELEFPRDLVRDFGAPRRAVLEVSAAPFFFRPAKHLGACRRRGPRGRDDLKANCRALRWRRVGSAWHRKKKDPRKKRIRVWTVTDRGGAACLGALRDVCRRVYGHVHGLICAWTCEWTCVWTCVQTCV